MTEKDHKFLKVESIFKNLYVIIFNILLYWVWGFLGTNIAENTGIWTEYHFLIDIAGDILLGF